MLGRARRRDLFDENALPMMQRIIQVSELQVTQVMVARAQMVLRRDKNDWVISADGRRTRLLRVGLPSAN